jgi:hypothetical protein
MRLVVVAAVTLLALCIIGLATSPVGAVTWLTVNGLTSGTLTTPGWLALRCDVSSAGGRARLVLGFDLNGNGQLDSGEPIMMILGSASDGGWLDEDTGAAVLRLSYYVRWPIAAPVVICALGDDGSKVEHAYALDYAHTGQYVSGSVRYEHGTPATGVILGPVGPGLLVPGCVTDAVGNYTMWLPMGPNVIMPEWSPWQSYDVAVPEARWVDVAVGEGKTGVNFTVIAAPVADTVKIIGTVRENDTGVPVPGVSVTAMNTETYDQVSGFSDINGSYTLPVKAGTWEVTVSLEDMVELVTWPYGEPPAQTVAVSSADVTVDFQVARCDNRIWGWLTGSATTAYPGAGVIAWGGSVWRAGLANSQGRFEIWVPGGMYYLRGDAEFTDFASPKPATQTITVPPDQQTVVPLLPRDSVLSGRVTFAGTATGVPYAYIGVSDPFDQYWESFGTMTDADGNYSVNMPEGDFEVSALGWIYGGDAGPISVTFPPDHTDFNFELTSTNVPPILSGGSVTPASGGAAGQVFEFAVTYASPDNSAPAQVYVVIDSWPRPMDQADPTDTNYADGAPFTYHGTLTVGAHSFWFGALDQNMLEALNPTSGAYSVTVLTAGKLKGQVRIAGTTTVIVGATVEARSGGVLKGTATTDANGVYEIAQGLPSGTYVVSAAKDGYVTQVKSSIAVTAGATTYVNFNLGASGTLIGQVAEKGTGNPIAGAAVKAYLGGVLKAAATTGANGVYTISRDLATGSYVVTASKDGYVTQTKGANVTASAKTYVNFNLDKLCLSGQVRQIGTTTALAGATVGAYQGDVLKGSGTTDANGIYQIGGLATGAYTVIASKSGYVKQTKPGIAFTTGAITHVNFNLAVSGKLMGQVWDKVSGLPIIGATVSARTGGVVQATGTAVGPWGVYQITSDLPAGTYTMLCTKSGYNDFGRLGIVVTAGATTYVNFPTQPQ